MLDKLSRKILKYMRENPNATRTNFHEGIGLISETLSEDIVSVRAAVKFLNKNEFVEYIRSQRGTLLGFRLTHMGLHSDEFERLEIMEKWKEWIIGGIGTLLIELIIIAITYGADILRAVLLSND